LYPATVETLAVQLSEAECAAGCCADVPESAMVAGEFVALLATVTLPARLPGAAGENVTFNVANCPGVRIKPAETPLTLKLGPARLTLEIVTFELPVFESVTLMVLFAPVDTDPKLRLAELAFSRVAAATAVPLSATLDGEPDALLITETVPEAAPTVLGEKTILRFAWCPAAIVIGNEAPPIVNPLAAMLA
jgi:hypothetical protein